MMDIRYFFGGVGVASKSKEGSGNKDGKKTGRQGMSNGKRKRKLEEDNEDDFQNDGKKASRSRGKPNKMKKSTIIYDSSDSEEEPPSKKKAVPTPKRHKSPVVSSRPLKKQSTLKTPSPPKLKSTTVEDFFGSSPVFRSNKKTPSSSKKPVVDESKPKKLKLEEEEHDDIQFIETLKQLDQADGTPKQKQKSEEKPSPLRRSRRSSSRSSSPARSESSSQKSQNNTSSGLASKLAAKFKASNTLIADTPAKSARSPQKSAKVLVEDTPIRTQAKKTRTPVKEVKETPARATRSTPQKSVKSSVSSPPKPSPDRATPKGGGDKRRGNAMYRSYLNREGPRMLGAKAIPEGEEGCLEGLTFVITGILEYIEKDEAKALVEKLKGRVTTGVSKKTNYLVVGRDAGETKMQKAQDMKINFLNEDELFDLIRTRPGKKISTPKSNGSINAASTSKNFTKPKQSTKSRTESKIVDSPSTRKDPIPDNTVSLATKPDSQSGESLMWVDKHKPDSTKLIIGQQGDRSPVAKLKKWLVRWQDNNFGANKERAKSNRDDGFCFKAALLSGPPGVGKTTSAQLVCQEAGFLYLELNASDARNKKSLEQIVAKYLHNNSIRSFFDGNKTEENIKGHKHCLIMDEVDGMAGNEDRGGIQELNQLIKQSHVPIICMCNDRSHPKMRSLSNNCFDLRFQRPRVKQIQGAMMKVAFKEGIKIPPSAMEDIIMAANNDIRQVLHNLSMWSAGQKQLSGEQLSVDAANAKKDMKLGAWDVLRKVFVSGEERAKMSFIDKMDLFFHDYSIAPLFVHENYMGVVPRKAKGKVTKHLDLLSKASDSLCQADLIDKTIRTRQSWSLLPTMAVFSSVAPGEYMQGHVGGMIQFPSWLGKNSTRNKNHRLLQELQMHMRLTTSTSVQDLNMGYVPHLRNFLTKPLLTGDTDGVPEVVQLLNDYDLTREDFDSILEVSQYTGWKEPMSTVPTKVKSAFTRTFNKEFHLTPYAPQQGFKKGKRGGKRGGAADGELLGDLEGEESQGVEEEESDNDDVSALIKPQKGGKGAGKGSAKGKGKAPAKGKGRVKGKSK